VQSCFDKEYYVILHPLTGLSLSQVDLNREENEGLVQLSVLKVYSGIENTTNIKPFLPRTISTHQG
jgi:hypothetical protein